MGCSNSRGARLGHLRRVQADRRTVPRCVHHRERRRRIFDRQPARAPVPRDLPGHDAALAGHDAGRDPRGHQPDQDQRHQRVLRLTGLDQLVHPRHQDLPRTHGLRSGQPGDRTDLDGSQHVRLPQHDPGLLRQLRYRLGRGRRLGHRDQQVLVEALPESPRVPTRDALRRQPRRLRVDAAGRGHFDPGVLRCFRFGDQAVLPDRRNRHRAGDAAGPGRRHQGKVLPTTHRRRHRSANVRRVREPFR